MFEVMRKVFGPAIVAVIIGAIALVFVFYGVYNPRTTRGLRGGAVAATVNGEPVSLQEYNREYQRRVEYFQNMMKGKADLDLLRKLGLKQQILEQLVQRKLLLQEAKDLGVTVADEEVAEQIQALPYFKKDGKFDAVLYKQLIENNRLSVGSFEDQVREDLVRNRLLIMIRLRARASDEEVRREFQNTHNQRQVDFVLMSREQAKKRLNVPIKEVDDFLKTDSGKQAAKISFEKNKFLYNKKTFEDVQRQVAEDVLKERRTEELLKSNHELANEVALKAKSVNLVQFKAFLKTKGLELKTSEKFGSNQDLIAGLGEVPELVSDAFKEDSNLLAGKLGKTYEARGNLIFAYNLKSFKPDLAALDKDKVQLAQSVSTRKEQQILEQWMGDLRSRAKVSFNKALDQPEEASE